MTSDFFIYFLFMVGAYILGMLPLENFSKNIFHKKDDEKNNKWMNASIFSLGFLKGFLSVFFPFLFGAPAQVQALCGIASIIGHNWSPFLNFKEEKSFPLLLGALLPLYLPLVLIMMLVCVIFSMLWSFPVAIMVSVLVGVMMSFANISLWNIFLLLFFSLVVLVLKRLVPLNDIFPIREKRELIENRIFFDQDDVPLFKLKVAKKVKSNHENAYDVEIKNSYDKNLSLSLDGKMVMPKPPRPKRKATKTASKTKKSVKKEIKKEGKRKISTKKARTKKLEK